MSRGFRKNVSIVSLLKIIKKSKDRHLVARAHRWLSFKVEKQPADLLVKILARTTDPLLKKLIKQRLWELGLDESYDSLVNVIRTSNKIDRVGYAVDLIGEHRYIKGVPLLISLLKNKHWYIRNRAALSLRDFRDQRALKPLIRAIQNTDIKTSVSNLVYSLEVLDCSSILPFLTDLYVVRSNTSWLTRIDILQVIKNTDLRKVKTSEISHNVAKIHKAMLITNKYSEWENLQELCDAIEKHRLIKSKVDLAWDNIKSAAELRAIRKSLKTQSYNPYLHRKLAENYYKEGHFAQAEKPMAKAYSLVRKNPLNIWGLAIVKANLNKPASAIKLFKMIVRMSSKAGLANLDTYDGPRIIDELKSDSRYNLAQCYLDLGEKSQAKRWLKSFIKIRGNGKPGKFKIGQAKRKLAAIQARGTV